MILQLQASPAASPPDAIAAGEFHLCLPLQAATAFLIRIFHEVLSQRPDIFRLSNWG
jgi:hypothetical protein